MGEDKSEVDDDGMHWVKTVGTGVPPTISSLEAQVVDVKALFKQKFGYDVDDEEDEGEVDDDGMHWVQTVGTGGPPPTTTSLEAQLVGVKTPFNQKFGYDVDDEEDKSEVDDDGMHWVKTVGTCVPPPTTSSLEAQLVDVKTLFKQRYGYDVDDEDDEGDGAH